MNCSNWHLSERDFFSGLVTEKEEFVSLSKKRIIPKNQFIFFEDDPGDTAFYIEQGEIKVFRISPFGKSSIVFIRFPGEIFGLAEVIGGNNRACSAQAMTRCTLYEINRKELEHLLSRHYCLTQRVMKVMGRRLRYLGEQIENLMVCDVHTRLLKLIIYLGHHKLLEPDVWSDPITIPIRLTQQQIAEMIGSCQQTVSETMKSLELKGLIRLSGREIILLKPTEAMNYIFSCPKYS